MVRIVTLANTISMNVNKPDDEGTVAFEAECDPDDFAHAALAVGQGVLQRYGMDGYNQRWIMNVFPLRSFRALETALGTQGPPPRPTGDTARGWVIYAPRKEG